MARYRDPQLRRSAERLEALKREGLLTAEEEEEHRRPLDEARRRPSLVAISFCLAVAGAVGTAMTGGGRFWLGVIVYLVAVWGLAAVTSTSMFFNAVARRVVWVGFYSFVAALTIVELAAPEASRATSGLLVSIAVMCSVTIQAKLDFAHEGRVLRAISTVNSFTESKWAMHGRPTTKPDEPRASPRDPAACTGASRENRGRRK